jgi:hypothetical protein
MHSAVPPSDKLPLSVDIGKAFGRALQRLSLKGSAISHEMLESAQQIAT